ncbi:MAG: PQQ-binding-like beta-propeller repeat protein [Chloroflexota bacterium]|nr:PQQ-binding-like beta-propeller repeat protein [Chloroflexota bacterium]
MRYPLRIILVVLVISSIFAMSSASLFAQEGSLEVVPGGAVYGTALSADGALWVVGTRDAIVNAYDDAGNVLWTFEPDSTVWSVATSADGSRTAVASEDRHVYLLDAQGLPLWSYRSSRIFVDVAMSADGSRVIASDENRDLILLDGVTGTVLWQKRLLDTADTVDIYGDESMRILVGSRDAYLTAYTESGDIDWQVRYAADVIDVAMTPDGTRGIIATLDGLITLINGADGATIWQDTPPQAPNCTARDRNFCLRVDISGDGQQLLIGTLDSNIYILDALNGDIVQQQVLERSVTSVSIAVDGSVLLYGDRNGNVRILQMEASAANFAAQQDSQRLELMTIMGTVVVALGVFTLWTRRTTRGRQFWQVLSRPSKQRLQVMWRSRVAYFLILPTLILLLVFNYYPAASGIYHAFTKWIPGIETEWVGLDNFRDIANSPYFFVGIRNAVILAFAAFIKLAVPLLVAELIFHIRNGIVSYTMRTLFIIPLVLPSVVTILLWVNIYDPNIGLLNQTLNALGLTDLARSWLGDRNTALPAIITIGFPWVSPFALLIFYGGLVAIPDELLDAAKVDGATPWMRFWRIDIPLIMGQIRLLTILAFIGSLQEFQSIFLTTGGGPGNATYTPALELYYQATRFNNFGLSSAMGAVLFFAILGGTLLNLRALRSRAEYIPG